MWSFFCIRDQEPWVIASLQVAPSLRGWRLWIPVSSLGSRTFFPLLCLINASTLCLTSSRSHTFTCALQMICDWYGLRKCNTLVWNLAHCMVSIVDINNPISLAKVIKGVERLLITEVDNDLMTLALSHGRSNLHLAVSITTPKCSRHWVGVRVVFSWFIRNPNCLRTDWTSSVTCTDSSRISALIIRSSAYRWMWMPCSLK